MTFTLTYAWWWVPAFITVITLAYSFAPTSRGDVDALFAIVGGLLVVATSWAIAGFFK